MKKNGATALTLEEETRAKTLFAEGRSHSYIGRALCRSNHTIKRYLELPDVAEQVKDEKAKLASLFEGIARRTIEKVTDLDIEKAGLRDKMVAAGIATEKSLLLKGELPSFDVTILVQLLDAVRAVSD